MEQSKELSKLLHTTVQARGEISAQSGNDDAEALRHLTTVIRDVSGWLMVSVKKGNSLSFVAVITPSNVFSAKLA